MMTEGKQAAALARIERAMARIDAAAARGGPARANDDEFEQLRRAHEVLRGRVQTAVNQIDRLLAGEGRR